MTLSRQLLVLLLCGVAVQFAQAGLLYQISLNGRGDTSQKEIDRIGQQAYRKTSTIIEKCYGAAYTYVAPGDQVDVDPLARNLIETTGNAVALNEEKQNERQLASIKLCPKQCRRKRNYDWCYLLGCICSACGGRRRFLKAQGLNKCDDRLNRVIGFLQRKYNVELEVFFFEVP